MTDNGPNPEEQARLAQAIELMSEQIREAAVKLGVAEHVALVAIKGDGEFECKMCRREEVARLYANNPVVVRLLARGADAHIIPVVASDLTREPSPIATARIPVFVQRGGDA